MSRDQADHETDHEAEGLTIAAAAHALGVSENAIRQRIKRESIEARKIDGMWRIWLTEDQAPVATTRPVDSDHEEIGRDKDGDHQADHEATKVATTVDSVPALIAQFESIRDQWLRPFVEDLNAKSERIGQLQERLATTEQRLAAAEQECDELRRQVDAERGRAYLDQSLRVSDDAQTLVADPDHLERVRAYVSETSKASKSPQDAQGAPGTATPFDVRDESKEGAPTSPRSVFGDFWHWVRRR